MKPGALLRRLSLAPFRLRLLFRGAFLLLAFATVGLTLFLLREEQQLSYRNYDYGLGKNAAEIAARLRHPSGQLALLNPSTGSLSTGVAATPLHPLLLPYSALDFDDPNKVQQAIEMAGCSTQYPDGSSACVAIGNNPYAGGYIYMAGSFSSAPLVEHARGARDLSQSHRLHVVVELRGQRYAWMAPFEKLDETPQGLRGRLTGFAETSMPLPASGPLSRPVKDFRGWLWQSPQCTGHTAGAAPDVNCSRRSFFSVRLPVALLRDALFDVQKPVWPPADLDRIQVHAQLLPPGDGAPLFNSDAQDAVPPFALEDLAPLLLPGEVLRIHRMDGAAPGEILRLTGTIDASQHRSRWIDHLIRRMVPPADSAPIVRTETVTTPLGRYSLQLTGDVRSVNLALSAVATRASWFVGAMLVAILVAWFVIELGIIRRINELRRRSTSVSKNVTGMTGMEDFDLSDLRGPDELGVLAACLADLLRRVQDDVQRERIRAEQEKDLWQAVGHEIMSPLQSLMVLHGREDDASHRYIQRMQQAVRVLYGQATPSEAFDARTLQLGTLDLEQFLQHVASNAPCIGIDNVEFSGTGSPLLIRADEHSLEDVVGHVLNNATRYRRAGTPIRIQLNASETTATIRIHNDGLAIPEEMIDRIFEYGVADSAHSSAGGHRGQGLFVAKTYLAKMAGTISANNEYNGVAFTICLPRA